MKAKRGWERGWRGMVKKASLRSNTVKWVAVGGRQKGVRVRDYWECRHNILIDFLRFWTSLQEFGPFLTARIGWVW